MPLYTSYITDQRKTEATVRLTAIAAAAKEYATQQEGLGKLVEVRNGFPTVENEVGFSGDFSPSKHFTFSQTSAAAAGPYQLVATGNGKDGVTPSMTVTMSCASPDSEPTYTYTGF